MRIIVCGHCGHPVTGELKVKKTKSGERQYTYYRCTKYNTAGHPRVRVTEAELGAQMLALFDKIKIKDKRFRNWFSRSLYAQAKETQKASSERPVEI